MDGAQFNFSSSAFADPAERIEENVNGMEGHALASWLSGELRARALDTSEVWAEDHGWDLSVAHGGAKYVIACLIEREEGETPSGSVVIGKPRSLMDKLRGRNLFEPGDPVAAAIEAALTAHPGVSGLTRET